MCSWNGQTIRCLAVRSTHLVVQNKYLFWHYVCSALVSLLVQIAAFVSSKKANIWTKTLPFCVCTSRGMRAVKSTNCQAANKCRSGVYKPSKSSYREAKLFFTCMCSAFTKKNLSKLICTWTSIIRQTRIDNKRGRFDFKLLWLIIGLMKRQSVDWFWAWQYTLYADVNYQIRKTNKKR